jgi:hypothetical protein
MDRIDGVATNDCALCCSRERATQFGRIKATYMYTLDHKRNIYVYIGA